MRPPVSADVSIYHIAVSHIPLPQGNLVRFNILFKPVGLVATIIVSLTTTDLSLNIHQRATQGPR
jgi:hypothetical protein